MFLSLSVATACIQGIQQDETLYEFKCSSQKKKWKPIFEKQVHAKTLAKIILIHSHELFPL